MPRYFFHVCDSAKIEDFLGIELPGIPEAQREAVRAMEVAKVLLPDRPFKVVVTDETGQEVFEVASKPA